MEIQNFFLQDLQSAAGVLQGTAGVATRPLSAGCRPPADRIAQGNEVAGRRVSVTNRLHAASRARRC